MNVTQEGDFISGTALTSITFAANSTTATLTVPTVDDEPPAPTSSGTTSRFHPSYEEDGSVTATLSAGDNYVVGAPPDGDELVTSAKTTVADNEPSLVRAVVEEGAARTKATTMVTVSEGDSFDVHVERFFSDQTAALDVLVTMENFQCFSVLRPEAGSLREALAAEVPFATEAARSATVTIPAGATTATHSFATQEDAAFECHVFFTAAVQPPAGSGDTAYTSWDYHPMSDDIATVRVTNDDSRPTISFTRPEVTEGNEGFVRATLRSPGLTAGYESPWPYTVTWWTVSHTAQAGSDFTAVESGTFTFPANPTADDYSRKMTVMTLEDAVPESQELILFGYRVSTPYANAFELLRQGRAPLITILDNDPLPTISAPSIVSTNERGSVSIDVTLSSAIALPVSVEWRTFGDTASSGGEFHHNDYEEASGTLTFPPNTTSARIVVNLNDDMVYELQELFYVEFSSPQNGTLERTRTQVSIRSDDRLPIIRLTHVKARVGEGEGFARFRVELIRQGGLPTSSSLHVTATLTPGNGTNQNALLNAVGGSDFVATPISVNVRAGTTSQDVDVPLIDDATDELDERFLVTLSNVTGARTLSSVPLTSSATIIDNDDLPRVSIADARFREPANPTSRTGRNLTVNLDRPSSRTITVTYRTVEGTAKTGGTNVLEHGDDYTHAESSSVSIAPGETSNTIIIAILGDHITEEEETFEVVLLSAANARLQDSRGTGTIIDRSRTPVIEVDTFRGSGRRTPEAIGRKTIVVALNHPDDIGATVSGKTVTVDYEVYDYIPAPDATDGPATFGVDYKIPRTGTLTFPPGSSSAEVFITIVDDQFSEIHRERFGFRLKDPVNAVLGQSIENFLVIVDNDRNPLITVDDSSAREDAGNVVFDVHLSSEGVLPVSFEYSTTAGTAVAVSDYTATEGTLTFTSGTTTDTITVPIVNDGVLEIAREQFTLALSSPTNGILARTSATGSIVDDDQALPSGQTIALVASTRELTVAEGDTNGTQFTVKLASQPSGTVTVTIGKGTGTGLTVTPATLTFTGLNWDTAQNAKVVAASDDDAEDDNDVLTLTASGGGYSAATRTLLVLTTDDDEAGLTLTPTRLSIAEGGTGTYTVKVKSQLVENVRIRIGKSSATVADHDSVTTDPTTLTFTAANWATAQTVTITAKEDDDGTNETVVLEHSGSGRGYGAVTGSVTVSTVDDDSVGLVIKDSGGTAFGANPALTVDEGTSTFVTVALATEPTGAVSVVVGVPNTADVTVDDDATPKNRTLSFTIRNWDVPQRVNISAAADDDTVAPPATTVSFHPDGADYASLASSTLTLNVRDTNTVSVVFSRDDLQVTEDATAGSTYTVRLGSQPQEVSEGTETVTVAISASANSGLTISPNSLTFTRANWSTGQTVTVTAAHDDDATDGSATLTHAASGAAEYASVSASLTVRIIDDDTPAITIVPAVLEVDEGGMSSYSVKLATKPDASVAVRIVGHANSDFSLDKTQLTFTTENWNVAQTVVVEAAEDDDAHSDISVVLHTGSGTEYAAITRAILLQTIEDEEEVLVISDTEITVAEGSTATFTVALGSLPSGAVTVALSGNEGTDVALSAASLSFTTENWATAQTVTITTSQDADAGDDTVIVQLSNTTTNYPAPLARVTITITDDETAGLTLSSSAVTIKEGENGSFTIRPQTPPSGPITVEFTYPSTSDLVLPGTSFRFTSSNWSTPQAVRFSALSDDDATNDAGVVITYTGKGFEYEGLTGTVSVTITDDDTNAFVFTRTDGRPIPDDGLSAVEGGQVSYAVRLDTEPSDTVTVTVNAGTSLTASPATLTFTTANWRTRQTVTLAVAQDDDASADNVMVGHTAAGGGYGAVTGSVKVAITDNDTPFLILLDSGREGLLVPEGAARRYRVRLGTEPSESVTVTISGHSGTDISPDKTTLTFTISNWNTGQTVEITAKEDDDAITDDAITLRHTAAGGDYAGKSTRTTARIVENDSDGFVLTLADGSVIADQTITVGEGTSKVYRIALGARPTGDVAVTLFILGTGISTNKSLLGFTPRNWNTPQSVRVTAGSDSDSQDAIRQVTHLAIGSGYEGHSFALRVVVEDDDVSAILVNRMSLEIEEGGTGNFAVRLATRPLGNVVVSLGLVEGIGLVLAELSLNSETLRFTTNNWNSVKRVVITAGQDANGVDERGIVGLTARGG